MSEQPRTKRTAHHRTPARMSALALACVVAAGAAFAVPAVASAGSGDRDRAGKPRPDAVQQGLDHLVAEDGYPAALAAVTDRKGRERNLVAGVGDLETGAPAPVDGQVRVGSNSKTFLATVVLQLVGEGAIGLDEPIEAYLPGVVRGDGIDGNDITVRDLLQHTSGIPSYTNGEPFIVDGATNFAALQDWYVEPYELLDLALSKPATTDAWDYSNTNYLLAGLIVQKVTQRPLAEAITERIIEPLGLTDTYVPARGERELRGEHPHGYLVEPAGAEPIDITTLDTAQAWASGDIVSTPSELNRFFSALIGGELLQPAELDQMKKGIDISGLPGAAEGASYGLGLMSSAVSCGVAWGHGGAIPGFMTEVGVTEKGRAITVTTTQLGDAADVAALIDTALCS